MYKALQTFTSKHGHDYVLGQEINDGRYLLLAHEDKPKFEKVKDPFWDSDNPSSPVASSMLSDSMDSGSVFVPDTSIPDSPTFGGFGGGDGGGGGAGGSWGDSGSSSDSSSSNSDSSSSSDYSSSSDSSSYSDSSSSFDSGSFSSDIGF